VLIKKLFKTISFLIEERGETRINAFFMQRKNKIIPYSRRSFSQGV